MAAALSGTPAIAYPGAMLAAALLSLAAPDACPSDWRLLFANGPQGEDVAGSRALQLRAIPLIDALFSEVNPIPVKTALTYIGIKAGPLRAPLTELEPAHKEQLKAAMKDFGLI